MVIKSDGEVLKVKYDMGKPVEGELQTPYWHYKGKLGFYFPHGHGVKTFLEYADREQYTLEGNWVEGKPDGKMIKTYADGAVEE